MAAGGDRRALRIAVWLAAIAAAGAVAVIAARGCDRPDAPSAGSPGAAPRGSDSRGSNTPERRDAPAAAADSTPGLVESARSEASARRYTEALALYQRAYDLDPRPATLLEIGRMLHLTGRCREARRAVQRVVASSPEPAIADDARQLLERIGRCD